MKKKLIFVVLIIILIVGALAFYFNKAVLPTRFKEYIVEGAQKILHRKITIADLRYHWLKGFIATEVKMYEKDSTDKVFLSVDRLSFSVVFSPGFKQQKIVVPFVSIESPTLYLSSSEGNEWNFQNIPLRNQKTSQAAPFPILLGNVSIQNGTIKIDKHSTDGLWQETIDQISLKASLSHKKGIQTDFNFHLPQTNGSFSLAGHYDLKSKIFQANLTAHNLNIHQFLNLWPEPPSWLKLKKATLPKLELMVDITPSQFHMTGNLAIENLFWSIDDKRNIQGKLFALNQLNVTMTKAGIFLSGGLIARECNFDFDSRISFYSHLSGQITSATFKDKLWTIQGDLLTQQTNIRWLKTRSFEGDLTLRNIVYERSPTNATVQLNGTSKNTRFEIKDRFVIQGDVGAQNLEVKIPSLDNLIFKGLLQVQNGSWQWNAQQKLTGNAIAKDFNLNLLNRKDATVQTDITLDNGLLILSSQRRVSANGKSENMTFHWKDEVLNAQGSAKFENGIFVIDDKLTYQGNPIITIDLQHSSLSANPINFKAIAQMNAATLTGLPIGDLKEIRGILEVEPHKAFSKELRALFLNSPASLRGKIEDFNYPILDIHASLNNFLLEDLNKILPTGILERFKVSLTGPVDLNTHFEGPFKEPKLAKVEAQAKLLDVNILLTNLNQSVQHVTGNIQYKPQTLLWQNLKGLLLNHEILLNGSLNDFTSPTIDTTLATDHLNLSSQFNIIRNGLEFLTLKGQYFNSQFDLKGDLHFDSTPAPSIKTQGKVVLNLEDIPYLWPASRRWVDPLNLKGIVTMDVDWTGSPRDFRNLNLRINGQSDYFSVKDFEWKNAFLTYSQHDEEIAQMNVQGNFHNGTFNYLSNLNLAKEGLPFSASLRIENAEVAQLAAHTSLKDKTIYGNFSIDALLNGSLKNWQELNGKGDVSVTEGYLGEHDLIKGILNTMVISELKKFTLTDALAQWTINNKRVITKNLRLISPELWLLGQGWIDFDKSINMVFQADFNTQLITHSKSLKRFTTRPLTEIGEFVPVRCNGSLDQPECKPDANPIKWLENIGGKLIDGVEGTLQGL